MFKMTKACKIIIVDDMPVFFEDFHNVYNDTL